MIDLSERQHLIDVAHNPEIYGLKLPAKVEGQWKCPHCKFEGDIEKIIAHLESECDLPYNTSVG